MEEPTFDRQAFVPAKEPPPRSSFPVAGLLLILAVAALGVFAFYKFANRDAGPGASDSADIAAIAQKLEEIEKRLAQIEKRGRPPSPEPSKSAATQESGNKDANSNPPAPRTVDRLSPPMAPQAGSSPSSHPPQGAGPANRPEELNALHTDVAATREQWKATTDRLGNVVGELGSQRGEIARNREGLGELLGRLQRADLAFGLQKKTGRRRVGPVSLLLASTDPGNQRYTLRLLANDKTILLKDRALNEAVTFYLAGVPEPFELVVTEIGKDQVAGKLLVPRTTAAR